jgi:superfamily II DNA or RNA helicase
MSATGMDSRGIAIDARSNCADDTPDQLRFSPARFERGAIVTARDRRWRVRGQRTFDRCALVALDPACGNRRAALTLVTPADAIATVRERVAWRRASVLHGCAVLARALGTVLGTYVGAPLLEILPWQFAAARMFVEGRATRVLVADEVGLGKTIQAALAMAVLEGAGRAGRVLVLVPCGLRDQWRGELSRIFGWSPTIVDARELRGRRATLPAHVSPWLAPGITIGSIDFVKQPEIAMSCAAVPWDLVVIDEAHALAPGTERLAAAQAIGRSARRLLLLTGTPHSGDEDAFAAMCEVGRLAGDEVPLGVIRRTADSLGRGRRRRVRTIRPRAGPAERRVHALLEEYVRRVWTSGPVDGTPGRMLAMTILLKRAASSLAALARSLAHRARCLDQVTPLPFQTALPFENDDGEIERADIELPPALAVPGLADRTVELCLVSGLVAATIDAIDEDAKLRVLARFVERTREPLLVFTEYRDTLHALADRLRGRATLAVLHGGLSRRERNEALRAFHAGQVRVLAATDVAAEGLNLHERCRVVLNVELPWTPTRLEQRIGRVDRLGQSRTVHALHLIGRHGVEPWIARRLTRRAVRADRSLRGEADVDTGDDLRAAAAALGLSATERSNDSRRPPTSSRVCRGTSPAHARVHGVAGGLADVELARVQSGNTLREAVLGRVPGIAAAGGPAIVRLSRARGARLQLPHGITVVIRFGVTVGGWTSAPGFAAIALALDWSRVQVGCAAALDRLMPLVRREAARLAAEGDPAATDAMRLAATSIARERALMNADVAAPTPGELQSGLFDKRAERQRAADAERRRERLQRHGSYLVALEADLAAGPELAVDPVLAFVVR